MGRTAAAPRKRKRGDFDDELIEVGHEQASKIIEYFRQKWGQPLDSSA